MTLTEFERRYGRDEAPPTLRWLRAGPVEVALHGADLRYARLGDLELVRRVYVAVRDLNWDTIGEVEREIAVEETADSFLVRSRVRHRRGPIDFSWNGVIEGSSAGTLRYAMDGRCESEFQFAKIGICVHHPTPEFSGRRYTATTPEGLVNGQLPLLIGAQVVDPEKGCELPLFDPFSSLTIELEEDGLEIDFAFEGQLFEMEDQRNWTDASLKTASTPSYLGFVHQADPGRRVAQQVEIRIRSASGVIRRTGRAGRRNLRRATTMILGAPLGRQLSPIGFGVPSDGLGHSDLERGRVGALRPAHLRADVDAEDDSALERALTLCAEVGTRLELALHVSPGSLDTVDALVERVSAGAIARVLVFERGAPTTTSATTDFVRTRFPAGIPIIGGTNAYFCDINRDRPNVEGLDGVAYSINPQVHAFDELSLVEALSAQAETVASARILFPHVPIVVTPVTLRPRFNPAAVADEIPPDETELPWEVDPRQMSDFCAVWTLGSIKALSESGASSVTYYETVGWRGLFERDIGNPQPNLFRSEPRMLFPVYHLFTHLRDMADGELASLTSTEPLRATGLAIRHRDDLHLIIGNLTHEQLTIKVAPRDFSVEVQPYGIEVVGIPASGD